MVVWVIVIGWNLFMVLHSFNANSWNSQKGPNGKLNNRVIGHMRPGEYTVMNVFCWIIPDQTRHQDTRKVALNGPDCSDQVASQCLGVVSVWVLMKGNWYLTECIPWSSLNSTVTTVDWHTVHCGAQWTLECLYSLPRLERHSFLYLTDMWNHVVWCRIHRCRLRWLSFFHDQ